MFESNYYYHAMTHLKGGYGATQRTGVVVRGKNRPSSLSI
jgi:hypothetical protein